MCKDGKEMLTPLEESVQPKQTSKSRQSEEPKQQKQPKSEEEIKEAQIEKAFVKAVTDAGGMALKFTSPSMNGVPDRLLLFKIGKCAFVELKAPGKQMRPLQRKRRKQLESLGFPVFCVDDFDQIKPVIQALQKWNPGESFPSGVGAKIPEIEEVALPGETGPPAEDGSAEDAPEDESPNEDGPKDGTPAEITPEDDTSTSAAPVQPEKVMPHEVRTP